MIDRLRAILNRPVRETRTGLVFALCVLVIALAVVALSRLGDPDPRRPVQHATPAAREAPDPQEGYEVTNPPVVSDYRPSDLPSEEGRNPAQVTRADGEQVRRATRRFLEGYLAFTYAHAPATKIRGATRELVARLAAEPPRVPPQLRRRRPRVELVHQDGTGEQRAAAIGMVDDGVTRYSVHVELRRTSPRGWVVTDVGA